ncbi:hypothetical protein GEMRC1_005053 [Eukaryota sp. GEM-RC1]
MPPRTLPGRGASRGSPRTLPATRGRGATPLRGRGGARTLNREPPDTFVESDDELPPTSSSRPSPARGRGSLRGRGGSTPRSQPVVPPGYAKFDDPKNGKTYYYPEGESMKNLEVVYQEHVDQKTSRRFFINVSTKKTAWKLPPLTSSSDEAPPQSKPPPSTPSNLKSAPSDSAKTPSSKPPEAKTKKDNDAQQASKPIEEEKKPEADQPQQEAKQAPDTTENVDQSKPTTSKDQPKDPLATPIDSGAMTKKVDDVSKAQKSKTIPAKSTLDESAPAKNDKDDEKLPEAKEPKLEDLPIFKEEDVPQKPNELHSLLNKIKIRKHNEQGEEEGSVEEVQVLC